ncbi:MAG: hypothetical protein JXL80_14165 [Planctomycetes bacterium]|nr:hypothetical protein [Planctomycetota bacterium]
MTKTTIGIWLALLGCLTVAAGCAKPPLHPMGDGSFVTESRATDIAGAVEEVFRRRGWQLADSDEAERTLADGTVVVVATYRGRTILGKRTTVDVQYETGQPSQVLVLVDGRHDHEASMAASELENLLDRGLPTRSPGESRTPQVPY